MLWGKLTFEEVNGLIGNQVTGQILRSVDTAYDQCTVTIGSLPELNETGFLFGLLEFDCTTHHGDCVCGVISCTCASETSDCFLCFSETTLSDEPPGRFGGDEEEDGEGSWEHPLECNGDSI